MTTTNTNKFDSTIAVQIDNGVDKYYRLYSLNTQEKEMSFLGVIPESVSIQEYKKDNPHTNFGSILPNYTEV